MTATYAQPQQARARLTEQRFLDALQELLEDRSFAVLTIDEIASKASLTRSAFLKRFGSKNQALLVLYARYCDQMSAAMDELSENLYLCANIQEACYSVSKRAEELQRAHLSPNRAMQELFMEELRAAPQTQSLFLGCFNLMEQIQARWLPPGSATAEGAGAAAHLIFTINHIHNSKQMPGLPQDFEKRHRLIAALLSHALEF